MVRGLATSPTDSKKRAVYIFFTSFSEPNSKLSIIWACKTKKQKFWPQITSAGMCKWIISDWKNVECSSLSPNKESKDFVQVSWSTALRNCRKLSPTLNASKIRALCKTSRKVRRRFASVRILVSATENYEEFSCTSYSEARHKITSEEYYSRLLINKLFICARCNC